MKLHNDISFQIYKYLTKHLTLPDFNFQLASELNKSVLFTINNQNFGDYFDDTKIISLSLKLFFPKDAHIYQLEICEKILNLLCAKEFKNLEYKSYNQTYETSLVYLNSIANPNTQETTFNFETYNDVSQAYNLDLTLYLKPKKSNKIIIMENFNEKN